VDAIEYLVRNGKIQHLAHEYSGKKQERAVINTHKPPGAQCSVVVQFVDGSSLKMDIRHDGSFLKFGDPTLEIAHWDWSRLVLRQDEVAAFINATKGEKYSSLLPLIGLRELEFAAENLRVLGRSLRKEADLATKQTTLDQLRARHKVEFGDSESATILGELHALHRQYCGPEPPPHELECCAVSISTALARQIAELGADSTRHHLLQSASSIDVEAALQAFDAANLEAANITESLVEERLGVLAACVDYVATLDAEGTTVCPACGRKIEISAFRRHIDTERLRLQTATERFATRRTAQATLANALRDLEKNLNNPLLKPWRTAADQGETRALLEALAPWDFERLRVKIDSEQLAFLEDAIPKIARSTAKASETVPSEIETLTRHQKTVDAAIRIPQIEALSNEIEHILVLLNFVEEAERQVREEIKERSEEIIINITDDVQRMWSILHPAKPIDGIRLYIPPGIEKAIDVGLKFHGVEQESPRLTLSEGYRNSLGLCIFLSLAKASGADDRPIVLDDVVNSFDREHRGMLVELLDQEFAHRQILLFTHDREWFAELRFRLSAKAWSFLVLRPWLGPEIGVTWSKSGSTFDEARALLGTSPEAAGNRARALMDGQLAIAAEKLRIPLPYLRGDRNDHRGSIDFLQALMSEARKRFKQRSGSDLVEFEEPLAIWTEVQRLLLSWANRASHDGTLTSSEASKLIETCERALTYFRCPVCSEHVWIADVANREYVQCGCGSFRWKYG
jgi:hypothetical protein